jgi:hypothetical protein
MAHFPSLADAAEARGGGREGVGDQGQGQQQGAGEDPVDEQLRLVLARLRIGEYWRSTGVLQMCRYNTKVQVYTWWSTGTGQTEVW